MRGGGAGGWWKGEKKTDRGISNLKVNPGGWASFCARPPLWRRGRIKKGSISRATICRPSVSNEGFAESKRFFEGRETEGSYFPPAWIYNSCIIRNDNEAGMEKRIRVSKAASDYN